MPTSHSVRFSARDAVRNLPHRASDEFERHRALVCRPQNCYDHTSRSVRPYPFSPIPHFTSSWAPYVRWNPTTRSLTLHAQTGEYMFDFAVVVLGVRVSLSPPFPISPFPLAQLCRCRSLMRTLSLHRPYWILAIAGCRDRIRSSASTDVDAAGRHILACAYLLSWCGRSSLHETGTRRRYRHHPTLNALLFSFASHLGDFAM